MILSVQCGLLVGYWWVIGGLLVGYWWVIRRYRCDRVGDRVLVMVDWR